MRLWPLRRIIKYGIVGSAVIGTGVSLHANDYNLNSIGIVRLGRSAITVFDIAHTYKTKLYYKDWDKTSPEYFQKKSEVHLIAAARLLELCRTNKGVYIKIGQHIGALEYLLPIEYVNTMKVLHANAPENSVEDLFKVIRQDLKVDPHDLFTSFAEKPLGTASLAQVHRATLKDGREVAVKVQHPYVKGNSIVDIKTMEYLVKLMEWVFPDFKMQWLVDESKKNLPKELDFVNEGRNAEKCAKMFQNYDWLVVPRIFWEYSTPRVLVMEYVEGGQVNDLEYIRANNINPLEVSEKLGHLYSQMIFIDGYVHSDPHPGNILLRKNKKGTTDVLLLDHGLYANLSNKFRYEYSKLWLSILSVDRTAMRYHSNNLGVEGDLYGLFACMLTGRPWDSVLKGVGNVEQTEDEKELLQNNTSLVINHIAEILQNMDRQMLLVLKTNDLIRSIETTLKTQNRMTAFWVMSKCCIKSIFQEEYRLATGRWERFTIKLLESWTLFKLNMYYFYRGIRRFDIVHTLKALF